MQVGIRQEANTLYFTDALLKKLPLILEKKLTIMEAPMGYGKTVAVKEYLRKQQADVVWICFSRSIGMNSWEFFCQSLEEQLPHCPELGKRLRTLGLPEDDQTIYQVIRLLREADFRRPVVFVLDDYQVVNTVRLSKLVEGLVHIGCPNTHAVLITRDMYCGNSEVLNLKGDLGFIGRADFVLDQNDILTYYNMCGVALTPEDTALLYQTTDGWISALYLYLLRYKEEGVLAFPTNIYELMDLELFSRLSEDAQNFLYAVCPLGTFDFQQADFVWTRENTRQIITDLRFKNAFVMYNDQTGRFYIHSIFLQFLERRLKRLPDRVREEIYARCGDYFLQEKDYDTAMRYYFAGDRFEQLLAALCLDQGNSISQARWPFYHVVLERCPAETGKRQLKAVAILVVNALLLNDMEIHERYYVFMKDCCAELPLETPGREKLAGVLNFIDALRAYNDIEAMGRHFQKALALAEGEIDLFTPGGPTWTMGAPSVLLMFHRDSGHLQRELAQMRAFLPIYNQVSRGHGAGGAELMEAEALFYEGKFEEARIASHAAEVVASKQGQSSNVVCALFLQARCAVVAGDRGMLEARLDEMSEHVDGQRLNGAILQKLNELSRGFLSAFTGRLDHVPAWLRSGKDMTVQVSMFAYPMFQIIYGRCLLLEQDYIKVIGQFQGLMKDRLFTRHALFVVYANIYIAAAQYALGWESRALQTLKDALDVALPDRLYMPFAESYAFIYQLLVLIKEMEPLRREIAYIVRLTDQLESGIQCMLSDGAKRRKTLLTSREQEMARLAHGGKSNTEIAGELFLAKSTVKRAMVDIFRKLGIHSREELAVHQEQFEEPRTAGAYQLNR